MTQFEDKARGTERATHLRSLCTPEEYMAAFKERISESSAKVHGICGRVLRGRVDGDFEKLSFLEGRRLAWVLGPDGLAEILGQTGRDVVLGIGKTTEWLDRQLENGMTWKLAVFPETLCQQADWDGLFRMIQLHYPEIAPKLLRWSESLKDPQLVCQIAPELVTSEVKDNPDNSYHMSVSRYMRADDSSVAARLFLWHSLGVNEQFTGCGYTRLPDGTRGPSEYLIANKRLADLSGTKVIDLDVR